MILFLDQKIINDISVQHFTLYSSDSSIKK